MGGSACKVIINSSGESMAVIGEFEEANSASNSYKISLARLKAYVREAVDSTMYTSLYFSIEEKEGVPAAEYTQPIIDDLTSITNKLPTLHGRDAQEFIHITCRSLRKNLNRLEELFD